MRFRTFLVTVVVLGTSEFVSPLGAAADWKERIMSEAPAKWKALDDFNLKLGGAYTQEGRVFGPGTYGSGKTLEPLAGMGGREQSHFRRNGDWIVTEERIERFTKDGTTTIERGDGRNSRYTFRLGKAANGDGYVL